MIEWTLLQGWIKTFFTFKISKVILQKEIESPFFNQYKKKMEENLFQSFNKEKKRKQNLMPIPNLPEEGEEDDYKEWYNYLNCADPIHTMTK